MPRLKELTAEDDSLDPCSPATDEDASRQFQAFKKTEYDSLHLSPGKSVLKVLWERVSAEIAQRSGHPIQAGVKGTLSAKKAWSPPATRREDYPMSRQRLPAAEKKPTGGAAWEYLTTEDERRDVADLQERLPATDKGRDEREQQVTEPAQEEAPFLATRRSPQVVWYRVSNTIDHRNIADIQEDNISNTRSREEQDGMETGKEGDNFPVWKSNPEHQRQLAEDVISSEKPLNQGTEDKISSKTQDSTSDFAPKGEQEDQDSVEEKVTTYDAVTKEQLEEENPVAVEPKRLVESHAPPFPAQDVSCRLTEYLEERIVFKEDAERNQHIAFMMESQQRQLPREKIQEDVKPRYTLHEDVPKSKTMDFLSCIPDSEAKGKGSVEEEEEEEAGQRAEEEEEQEVPYLSYNPPEPSQEAQSQPQPQEVAPDPVELQDISRDEKIEALRKELESLEAYDEEDAALYDEECAPLSQPARVPEAAAGRPYVMPDPVRARLDEEVLLYHVPRSPEAPRRFSDKVFFRFK